MMPNNRPGMKNTVPARDCNTKTGAVCLGETNVKFDDDPNCETQPAGADSCPTRFLALAKSQF